MADVSFRRPRIRTGDGCELAATAFEPPDEPRGTIVVNSALAIPRQFYRDFAHWFAAAGFCVLTYDFRGIGDSAPDDLRDSQATAADWALRDIPAAMEWARQNFDASPLYVFGHSMGGQVMGLLGSESEPEAMVTFSAQTGYWRLQTPGHRWRALVAMGLLFPAITRLVGYLPWSMFFGGTDIPAPAARQWMDWCLNPDYLLGDTSLEGRENFRRFSAPILAYSFEDDAWGHRPAVDWMMERYCNAELDRIHLDPREVGVDAIGHFGFFRAGMEFLWDDLVERLPA